VVCLKSQRGGLYRLCVAHQLMYSFGGMSAYIGLRLFSFKFLFIVKNLVCDCDCDELEGKWKEDCIAQFKIPI